MLRGFHLWSVLNVRQKTPLAQRFGPPLRALSTNLAGNFSGLGSNSKGNGTGSSSNWKGLAAVYAPNAGSCKGSLTGG